MSTRQQQVIETLRTWVINGKICPQQKYSEAQLAEALQVSRTPVRHALTILLEEGLLVKVGVRGYTARQYNLDETLNAIEIHALLEGYAATLLARSGLTESQQQAFQRCLQDGDELFSSGALPADGEQRYAAMNLRFHSLLLEFSQIELLTSLMETINRIPFAGPGAIVFEHMDQKEKYATLVYAHHQHHSIVDAIVQGNGARAEALLREHAETIKKSYGIDPNRRQTLLNRTLPIVDSSIMPL